MKDQTRTTSLFEKRQQKKLLTVLHKHVHVFKERICNPERAQTVDEFEHFGTGSGFYIQNGTGIQSVIEIPRDEHKLQRNHPWKAEKCFWTQGDNPLQTNK